MAGNATDSDPARPDTSSLQAELHHSYPSDSAQSHGSPVSTFFISLGITTALTGLMFIAHMTGWPPVGDETHFVETSKQFATNYSFELLRTYEEMSGPLPFILYGLFGAITQPTTIAFRICNLLLAGAFFFTYIQLLKDWIPDSKLRLFAFIVTVTNPYTIYLSIYVHTDIPTLLFCMVALLGLVHQRATWLFIGAAGALLCRQYLVFFVCALILITSLECFKNIYAHHRQHNNAAPSDRPINLKLTIAALASVFPLLALMLWWGGPQPDNELQLQYTDRAFRYHIDSLIVYLAVHGIYCLPALPWYWRWLFSAKHQACYAIALAMSCLIFLFPVAASQASADGGIITIGLFHRALFAITDLIWIHQIIFAAGLFLGTLITLRIIILAYTNLTNFWQKNADMRFQLSNSTKLDLIADTSLIFFLTIMPLSYLHWEKYYLPLWILLIPRLMQRHNTKQGYHSTESE